MKKLINLLILVISFSVYSTAFAAESPILKVIKNESIENAKFTCDKAAIDQIINNDLIREDAFDRCKEEVVDINDLAYGNPFCVFDPNDNLMTTWAEGGEICKTILESNYYWILPILYRHEVNGKIVNDTILDYKVHKEEDNWSFNIIDGAYFLPDESNLCSNPNDIAELLSKNGINNASRFCIFAMPGTYMHMLYIKTDKVEYLIPLKHVMKYLYEVEDMTLYKRDDVELMVCVVHQKYKLQDFVAYDAKGGDMIPVVLLNKENVDFDGWAVPLIEDDSVLIPVRKISEALNAKVNWNESTNTVTLSKDGIEIRLTIGDLVAYKNNIPINLDGVSGGRFC